MREWEFENLLDILYQACRDTSKWQLFGDVLSSYIGGSASEISLFELDTANIQSLSAPYLSDAQIHTYVSETIHINPRIPKVLAAPDCHQVYSDHIAFDIEKFKRHPFIDWTRSEIGLQFMAGSCFTIYNDTVFAFLLHRTVNEGIVNDEGIQLLNKLFPHIRRAAQLTELLGRDLVKSHLYSAYLENAFFGISYMDASGRVNEMNALAKSYIDQSPEITITKKGELITTAHASKNIVTFFSNIDLVCKGHLQNSSSSYLKLSPNTRPIALHAVPVSSIWGEEVFLNKVPKVLIYFFDAGLKLSLTGIMRICAHLGLTRRESEIAEMLYRGNQPKVISDHLAISENTVRVFIRIIHQKLGIRRQSELARLLAELNSFWPS